MQPCKGSLIPRHHPSGAAQQEGSEPEMETGGRDTEEVMRMEVMRMEMGEGGDRYGGGMKMGGWGWR